MGGLEEVDVSGEVLAKKLDPEAPASLGALGRPPFEPSLGPGLDAPELTE
jgi:hypothetical protein